MKILRFFRSTFTRNILVWKFYTFREFFEKGGYIHTLIPDSENDYYTYRSYETFVNDYPDNMWRVGNKTRYVLGESEATPENVPEPGFVCRVPKPVPRYENVAIAIIILGLLIGLVTMFCISSVVGFLYVAAVSTVIGMILYRNSMKVIINK